jgi:type VI secretion system protein ImpA
MDTDLLLAPLPGGQPGGEDLSFSSAFDDIAEMRRADDPTLKQGEWVTPLKQADWAGVARLCETLLATRTKDLRPALWLTEARAMVQGYAGLASGLGLCAALCEQHWAHLHPLPDGDDAEERIGNIAWMLQRLGELATALPITAGRKGERFTLQDLKHARQWQAQAERAGQPPDTLPADRPNAITVAQFRQALQDTPAERLREAVDALRGARAQLQAWQGVVDGRLGHEGPSFVSAREALEQASHELERLARETGALAHPSWAGEVAGEVANGVGHGLESAVAGRSPGPGAGAAKLPAVRHASGGSVHTEAAHVGAAPESNHVGAFAMTEPRTRAEALRQLQGVADFFRRTEPHSPVAYLADKAIKWGEMPLHRWLGEVVKDPASMAHLQELLGLSAPADGMGS